MKCHGMNGAGKPCGAPAVGLRADTTSEEHNGELHRPPLLQTGHCINFLFGFGVSRSGLARKQIADWYAGRRRGDRLPGR